VTTGGVLSIRTTVTTKDFASLWLVASVAVHVTVVGPTMKRVSEALLQFIDGVTPLLSVALGES
jgi:hypothetical protein